jgi:hypothetical protein
MKQYTNDINRLLKLSGLDNFIVESSNDVIDNKNGAGLTPVNQEVDYFGNRVLMKPSVFLKLAASAHEYISSTGLKKHIEDGGKVASPFLYISLPEEWDVDGVFDKNVPRVSGHEGRNRCKAILDLYGDQEIEVHLLYRNGVRSRHITPDILHNLNLALINENGKMIKGPFFKVQ